MTVSIPLHRQDPTAVVLVSNTALRKGTYSCILENSGGYEFTTDIISQDAIWLNPYTLTFIPPGKKAICIIIEYHLIIVSYCLPLTLFPLSPSHLNFHTLEVVSR